MSLSISGQLVLPNGTQAANAEIYFTAVRTSQDNTEVITGSRSVNRCDAHGNYSINIEYGRYQIATRISTPEPVIHGNVTISTDIKAKDLEDLIDLISADGNITDELLERFSMILSNAEDAADRAEKASDTAAEETAQKVGLMFPVNSGNWSTVAGTQLTEVNRYKAWSYPDNSDNRYAVRGGVNLPISIPDEPDENWYLSSAVNVEQMRSEAASRLGFIYQGEWGPYMVIPAKSKSNKYCWSAPNLSLFITPRSDSEFKTGGSFNSDNWILSETLTKQGYYDFCENIVYLDNPKYSAKGDGKILVNGKWVLNPNATNDDAAVIAAVNDLIAVGGGRLVIYRTHLITHLMFETLSASNLQFYGIEPEFSGFVFDSSGGRKVQPGYPRPTFAGNNSADGMFFFNAAVSNQNDDSLSIKNIKFRYLGFDMNVETNKFDELLHCICGYGVSGFDVQYCKFVGFLGDGVCISRGDGNYRNAYNSGITIQNNEFDGVNNDNRNGVSIYYSISYNVSLNTFRNCTRPDMPGAIDIEPDDTAKQSACGLIAYNRIYDCNGGLGAIAVVTRGDSKQQNINIIGNYVKGCRTAWSVINLSSNHALTDDFVEIKITGNYAEDFTGAFITRGVNGVEILGNTWKNQTGDHGSIEIENCADTVLERNNFNGLTSVNGITCNSGSTRLTTHKNKFTNTSNACMTINYSSDWIRITDNVFDGSGSGLPVKIPLQTMPNAQFTKFEGNVSKGAYGKVDGTYLLTLLTQDGNPVLHYDKLLPSQYQFGTTEFYSEGRFPVQTGLSTTALCRVSRADNNLSPTSIVMELIPTDPAWVGGQFIRTSDSNDAWGEWYKQAWVAV